MIHLDTHVVVWLAAGLIAKVPSTVQTHLETDDLSISPMVRLELTYLHEIGRLTRPADDILGDLVRVTGLVDDATPLVDVVAEAQRLTWTRDPFDRMIVGQSLAAGCRLATGDRAIRAALPDHAIWA